ncbi:MAG: mechanosensitive ion channel, partial [Leptospiraceae bacterium]|nr:mechanosensitive ion channel [Leptospiraceae bacterium]
MIRKYKRSLTGQSRNSGRGRLGVKTLMLCLLFICASALTAQVEEDVPPPALGYGIQIQEQEVFQIYIGRADQSAADRARYIQQRIDRVLAENPQPDGRISAGVGLIQILLDNEPIAVLTTEDAAAAGTTLPTLAAQIQGRLDTALVPAEPLVTSNTAEKRAEDFMDRFQEFSRSGQFTDAVIGIFLLLGLLVLTYLISRFFNFLHDRFLTRQWSDVVIRGHILFRGMMLGAVIRTLLKFAHLVTLILLVYGAFNRAIYLFALQADGLAVQYIGAVLDSIVTVAIIILVWKTSGRLLEFIIRSLPGWQERLMKPLRFQELTIISNAQMQSALLFLVRAMRLLVRLSLLYLLVTLILGYFPLTRGWSNSLQSYIMLPLQASFAAVVDFLPNLFFIAIIVLITYYAMRFIRLFFREIETERVTLPGFYSDWAQPTYRIAAFAMAAFSAVLIFPYLPGSGSEAFKGISIFLGFLISLGSSAVIANIMAGLVVTYMRPFQIGDRVKIADTIGDVVEKNLLVTRLRTIKNVIITIPNGMVLSSHIINYSASNDARGLILHTAVTIGYDVPWRTVHNLLIAAARNTNGIKTEPGPFVHQTELSDFYVAYELNASTEEPNRM